MALPSLGVFYSCSCPEQGIRSEIYRNFSFFSLHSDFLGIRGKALKLQNSRTLRPGSRVRCGLEEGQIGNSGGEPPEWLFKKELKKRGMTPTSLVEKGNRSMHGLDGDTELEEDDGGFSEKNMVSTDIEESLSNQRERSMALNSEGLEGFIPRARLLLTTGGTFFIRFWPFAFVIVAFFSAVYLYFGPSFIHPASKTPLALHPYSDPYTLLHEERISGTLHVD